MMRSREEKNRLKQAEEGIKQAGKQYYRTDLAHRWIWWQSKGDVERRSDQVQRVQIRRMERDLYEADELVKRFVRRDGGVEDGSAVRVEAVVVVMDVVGGDVLLEWGW